MTSLKPVRIRAPGRIVLFGEHSDYIGLDVIPSAITLSITIEVSPREDKVVEVEYLDLDEHDEFRVGQKLSYRHKRDYLRSAFNIMRRKGCTPIRGADLRVRGEMPIAAGLSSSSALSVAAVMAAAYLSDHKMDLRDTALTAFDAEVTEFGESGGMQDHFASVYGGIIHLDFGEDCKVTRLAATMDGIVIGDSLEKKADTVSDIEAIKSTVVEEYAAISEHIGDFNHRTTPINQVYELFKGRPSSGRRVAEATLRNRDLTASALELLISRDPNPSLLGKLLDEHHSILRDGLDRSTSKIESMIAAAKAAGALGCKINGSGGGGTMIAYAPGREQEVADAMRKSGGVPYLTSIGQGASIEPI
ncbi:MAG: GHMP kinase [Candidatus Thorarchaeota archaeon]|nr:MAG: GHMP kinase [Candidatus Thorarchaeota archaeon]